MKKRIVFYLGIIVMLGSCYPQGPEYYEDLDVVYTNYDEQYDFAGKGTYAIPDKIVKITGDLIEGEDPEFVKEPYNSQVLQKIEENCQNLAGQNLTTLPMQIWYYYRLYGQIRPFITGMITGAGIIHGIAVGAGAIHLCLPIQPAHC